jgi:hypothetical protein
MPKRRRKFGRSQKRGGDRKLGFGGDGLEYVPPVRGTTGVVAVVTNNTQLSLKYIPKKTLLRQLQQIEVTYSIVVDVSLCLSFVLVVRLTHNIVVQPNRLNVNLRRDR